MNQSHSTISDIVFHKKPLDYKRSYYRQEVQLEFREESQLFLEAVPLQTNSHFQLLLKDYVIKIQQNNHIVFDRKSGRNDLQHREFLKKIERFLDGFEVLVISQPLECEKSLQQLRNRILSIDERIGASKEIINSVKKTKTLIFYYPCTFFGIIKNQSFCLLY